MPMAIVNSWKKSLMNKIKMKMMKNKYTISFIVSVLFAFMPYYASSQGYYKNASMNEKHKLARKNVVDEQFAYAIDKYSELLKKEDNSTVRAEYAYALALAKCYDGAIMNLDKVLISGKADKTTLFYTAQVLKLMEYDELADVFWTAAVSNPPSWLWASDKYISLADKYKSMATINTDALGTALQRVNFLVAQKQYIQSIVLYQELVETYPNEYLPYIGFSALWESLGYKELAIKYLRQGLAVMGNNKTKFDTYGIYQKHLDKLETDNNYESKLFQSHKLKELGEQKEQNSSENNDKFKRHFGYIGTTYINKTFTFNAKYGFYTSEKTTFSFNLGYSTYNKSTLYTGALSYSFRPLDRVLDDDFYMGISATGQMTGIGVSETGEKTGGEFDFGLGLVEGVSIPLKNKKSSIDLTLGIYYMFKTKNMSCNVAIGYTRYF